MILVGELSLWVALLVAAWATVTSFAGGALGRADLVASGERAVYATWAFVALAAAGLWTALITHDFSLRYVASFTSATLPFIYTLTAFWAGQAGSMLFWCLILSTYSAIAVVTNRHQNRVLMPYVAGTLAAITLFFLATMCFGQSPFERLDWIPADGRGMNPQLQNPGMAIHPPNLYLGYVATAIPFAFAIAALITRRLDGEWLAAVRRWSLISWFFLTIGITLGMWWAYVELGWGGYWAWDPVENASLLPWLTGTAFLHSIMIQSVHSFAQSPVGVWFGALLVISLAVTSYLVVTRLHNLEAKAELESMLSREAAFLYNNVLLVGIAFSVMWGTLFPILSEAVRGTKITVGPPFFNAVNVPLGLLLLALTGIGSPIAWRRASVSNLRRQFAVPTFAAVVVGAVLLVMGMREWHALIAYTLAGFVSGTILPEFYKGVGARMRMHGDNPIMAFLRLVARNRRRYGGYIVHAGVVMLFCAFAGLAFKREFDVTLGTGQAFTATDPYGHEWVFVSDGISLYEALNRQVTAVTLKPWRDGRAMPLIESEKRQHVDSHVQPRFERLTARGI